MAGAILIIAFCTALFFANMLSAILKYQKIKKSHRKLANDKKYPSKINSFYLFLRNLYFVFGLFSVVGCLCFFLGGNDLSTTLQFGLFIALPANILFSALAFFAQSKWEMYWIFDVKCFYKHKTDVKYYYSDIPYVNFGKFQNGTVEICINRKSRFINVYPQYTENIISRIPHEIMAKSKEYLSKVQKKSDIISPLNILGCILVVLGMLSFFTCCVNDVNRTRDFSEAYKCDSPLPIVGQSSIFKYNSNLYVYIDNQGGVNVYDLNGSFKYALLIDFSSNGMGGMFYYNNKLFLESRNYHYYIIQNDTLINDDSLENKLTNQKYITSFETSNGKYTLALLGNLLIDGRIVHSTDFFQWYINSPFACWSVAILGIAFIGINRLLLRKKLKRLIKKPVNTDVYRPPTVIPVSKLKHL